MIKNLQAQQKDTEIEMAIKHYEMLARRVLHKTNYHIVSWSNPKEHKNWKFFEYLVELCFLKEWSPRSYIEAQFERLNGKVVYVNTLCCDKAIIYYMSKLGKIN